MSWQLEREEEESPRSRGERFPKESDTKKKTEGWGYQLGDSARSGRKGVWRFEKGKEQLRGGDQSLQKEKPEMGGKRLS